MSLNGYIVELESSMKGAVSEVAALQAEVAELKSMMLSYLAKEQRCPSLSAAGNLAARQAIGVNKEILTSYGKDYWKGS